jgi:protein AroM
MIALIALGHSPRPDHEEVYELLLPGVPRKLAGALDALSCDEARKLEDKQGVSPLLCLLNDNTTVEIPLPVLFPYIERQIEVLAAEGAELAVVLCCGGFPRFNSLIPVLLPGMIVPAMVKATCPDGKVGIIVPNQAQESAAVEHWKELGVEAVSAVVSPYERVGFEEAGKKFRTLKCNLVAIDCMGFKEEHRDRLSKDCGCPVILPKTLVAIVAGEMTGQRHP